MSLIQRKTFEINGAHVTVRSSSGFTESKRQAVMHSLFRALGTLDEDKKVYIVSDDLIIPLAMFSTFVVHTEKIEGDLGFEWPSAGADGETLKAALFAFDECMPPGADTKWSQAIEECDTPPSDPDLRPVKGDEKKS